MKLSFQIMQSLPGLSTHAQNKLWSLFFEWNKPRQWSWVVSCHWVLWCSDHELPYVVQERLRLLNFPWQISINLRALAVIFVIVQWLHDTQWLSAASYKYQTSNILGAKSHVRIDFTNSDHLRSFWDFVCYVTSKHPVVTHSMFLK